MLADGILLGPELLRHGLADQDHGRSVQRVPFVEVATSLQRYAHGAKVTRGNPADRNFGLFRHGDNWLTFDRDGLGRAAH